ncbi:MAG: hypothetical protein ABS49_03895 [Erythrobacter sp. SCN 62-14]|nr:MAG: hypothetical protein ABS49_03895 [Erythrobacter sp. SCN 62-14]
MPAPAADPGRNKVPAIQLLRILAAATVAVLHIAYAFAEHIGTGLGLSGAFDHARAGQGAVMLFFVISGYVMVISSRALFGDPRARRVFWLRRIIRIMPPYWLATGLLVLVFLTLYPRPIDLADLVRSLALVPYWPADGGLRAIPFLWVGWTLFFEMVFYFWFGLFLVWRREAAIAAVGVVLAALMVAGSQVGMESAFAFTLTRPVSGMFLAGMVLALWRERGGQAQLLWRLAALAAALLTIVMVPPPAVPDAMALDYVLWCGVPALLLAFAVLSGPIALPWPVLVNRAGDVSYALYLLHVPMAWLWLWTWPKLTRRPPFIEIGPWNYAVTATLAALVAAWAFFTFIEKPMTLALNRGLVSPHRPQG